MNKKIKVSVSDIVNKVASPKFETGPTQVEQFNRPIVINRPMRFQDLYKKIVSDQSKNNEGNSLKVLYESKKVTPLHTNRVKKKSATTIINKGGKSYGSSEINSAKKSASSCNNITMDNDGDKKIPKDGILPPSHKKLKKLTPTGSSEKKLPHQALCIDQCFEFLNHEEHSHIRERNQCFLSEKQIGLVMKKMGYDVKSPLYVEFLSLLEVDIYGGTPSQNLKQVLKIIEQSKSCNFYTPCKESLPKIVDNNLQLTLTDRKKVLIRKYFYHFAANVPNIEKENEPFFANQVNHISSKLQSFENILKEKTNYPGKQIQKPTNNNFSSPEKKILSSGKKNQIFDKQFQQVFRHGSNQKLEQDMNTFRKIQSSGFQVDGNQYNFSRTLSGDKAIQSREQESIAQLKSRLNEALKKTCTDVSYFGEEFQRHGLPKHSEKPILSVDVNLGEGISQKIIVYEGETAKEVSERLASKFTISLQTKNKFQKMLQSHLNTMLWKIDELSEQMLTDRDRDCQ